MPIDPEALRRLAPFAALPAETQADIAAAVTTRSLAPGETAFRQGEPGDALYIITDGRVAVTTEGRDGGSHVLAELGPGSYFGEMALLTGDPRSATVTAAVETRCLRLARSDFERLMEQRPEVARHICRTISGRLYRALHGAAGARRMQIVRVSAGAPGLGASTLAVQLAPSIARLTGTRSLLLAGQGPAAEPRADPAGFDRCAVPDGPAALADCVARHGEAWRGRYAFAILDSGRALPLDEALRLRGVDRHVRLVGSLEEYWTAHGGGQVLPLLSPVARDGPRDDRYVRRLPRRGEGGPPAAAAPSSYAGAVDRLARALAGRTVGVALGSGAAWGYAHIGVLACLEEAGIPIDAVAGTSIGSIVGALYAAGRSAAEIEAFFLPMASRWRWIREWMEWGLALRGMLTGRKFMAWFTRALGDLTFGDLAIPFAANAFDIIRGVDVVFEAGHVAPAVRASMAVPGIIAPVPWGDGLLVDGGVSIPVPVGILRDRLGCDVTIAVNSMPSIHLTARAQGPGAPRLSRPVLLWRTYQEGAARLGGEAMGRATIALNPPVGQHFLAEFHKVRELIAIGRDEATRCLPAIRRACLGQA